MTRKNTPNARNRILQAAVKVFAEKSFEGARIEEIASEARVPKSLIYYHFESKDKLLEVLTQNFIDEYTALILKADADAVQNKVQGLAGRMKNYYYDFGQRNADLIRVMFIDSLKKSKERPVLYKVLEALFEVEKKLLNVDTLKDYNLHEQMITEFFTNFIPNYAYICFADSWTKYFGIDRKTFDDFYMKAYLQSHGSFHKN